MISIIIPIYNTEKYLKRCIDSVLNQTYKDIEVLLIDDGSKDNSGMICDEYTTIDNRVKVFHKPNQGVSAARNMGLDTAKGDYIGFVDSDDYIEPEMYEKMLAAITEENAQVCCCGYYLEEADAVYYKCCEKNSVYEGTEAIFRAFCRQDYDAGLSTGNCVQLFKRDIIGDTRYKKYAHGEDIDFQFNIFKKSNKVVCITDLFYHYVKNEASATGKSFNEDFLSILSIADDVLEYVKYGYPSISLEAYAFHLTWYMVAIQKIYDSRVFCIGKLGYNKYITSIRKEIKRNIRYYIGNKYAKRLDKYYMYALLYRCMPLAIAFRSIVLFTRKRFKI